MAAPGSFESTAMLVPVCPSRTGCIVGRSSSFEAYRIAGEVRLSLQFREVYYLAS